MPRVLVLGATGYIGNALCLSLLRSGQYQVWGVCRKGTKALALSAQEITPVLCEDPVSNPTAWVAAVEDNHIDAIIDAAGANVGSLQFLSAAREIAKTRLTDAKKAGVKVSPKLGFLYTSGMWVHGSSTDKVSDTTPVGRPEAPSQPPRLLSQRPGWEQAVLMACDELDVMVVRPALLYGASSRIWDRLLGPLVDGVRANHDVVRVPVAEGVWTGLIHLDDTVSGLHAAVDKLPLIAGSLSWPVFDLVTSYEPMDEIVKKAAEELQFKGRVELVGPGNDIGNEALGTSLNGDSSRAMQLLGWQPKRIGFLPNMKVFAMAFGTPRALTKF